MHTYQDKQMDAELIGKQQLMIKAQLSQRNALVAKQQLAIKSTLATLAKSAPLSNLRVD